VVTLCKAVTLKTNSNNKDERYYEMTS